MAEEPVYEEPMEVYQTRLPTTVGNTRYVGVHQTNGDLSTMKNGDVVKPAGFKPSVQNGALKAHYAGMSLGTHNGGFDKGKKRRRAGMSARCMFLFVTAVMALAFAAVVGILSWKCLLQKKHSPCASDPCLDSASCYERDQNYTCLPRYEIIGKMCLEVTEGPCTTNPCQNYGECYERDGNFTCVCPEGYGGRLCETVLWTPLVPGCIQGYNALDVGLETDNVAACMVLCEAARGFVCCSFDYLPETGWCYLSEENSITAPEAYSSPCYDGKNVTIAERRVQGCVRPRNL